MKRRDVAAKTAADVAANLKPETLLVMGLVGFVVINGIGAQILKLPKTIVGGVKDLGEGIGNFGSGVWNGAENEYIYSLDQSGSPNPPDFEYWHAYGDGYLQDGYFDAPVAVRDATAVPTSPIFNIITPSTAEDVGGFVHERVTGLYTDPLLDIGLLELPSVQEIGSGINKALRWVGF